MASYEVAKECIDRYCYINTNRNSNIYQTYQLTKINPSLIDHRWVQIFKLSPVQIVLYMNSLLLKVFGRNCLS